MEVLWFVKSPHCRFDCSGWSGGLFYANVYMITYAAFSTNYQRSVGPTTFLIQSEWTDVSVGQREFRWLLISMPWYFKRILKPEWFKGRLEIIHLTESLDHSVNHV